ncbi:PP2C family protein-serine/threonine phosphatase [Streptomyces sp. NPDC001834]|uniref:PP2C family protein-serine/threonine phosphatase n=1 Tax=Streptomyces sp. NPDC001834 TaxID=3364616 RepID=UPI00368F5651
MWKRLKRRGGHAGGGAGGVGVRRFVRMLPTLMIVGGLLFELLTPTVYTAIPLFVAAPLIAAPFFSLANTVRTGIAAMLAVFALRLATGSLSAAVSLIELLTLATVSVLAVVICEVVRRSSEQLASARVIAERAMRAVLPKPSDRIGGLHVAVRYEAAQADEFVGGDLYAVTDTPYGVRLVVGDVRGKGLDAVETVAVVIGAFREAAEQERSLEGVARRLERALAREGEARRGGPDATEGFTTAVLAEIPAGLSRVRIVNRGHPEPILLYPDGVLDVLEPSVPALPLGMGLGAWPDRTDEWDLPPGATLLLYTDGLSEARNEEGDFYDPAARLRGRIFPDPEELLSALTDDVRLHTGGESTDDMALLAVVCPAAGQPERRRPVRIVGPAPA